ncbi:very short patch repair endonuclease [Streptomyces sp. SID11233]|nr:very short patch repair endonuclease [Streptomyces sp. SID11233]
MKPLSKCHDDSGVTAVPDPTDWTPPDGSWASSAARRRNMQAIRSRDTQPERLIRRLVHANGLRYRVAARPLPDLRRTADLVFRPARVAVFIDGCYWHGCPEHYVAPKTNPGYWSDKVARNVARDRDTDKRLTDAGWLVLRFWEHQDSDACALRIVSTVRERRRRLSG